MSRLLALISSSLFTLVFALNAAHAQILAPVASDCEAKAVDKTGKALSGATKSSFLKKCESDAKDGAGVNCEAKALSSAGKPLAGAAKASFVKKCEADAKAAK